VTTNWDQVREVVDAVLELPPSERGPYLDRTCPEPNLRRHVESLIHSFENTLDFLDDPAGTILGGGLCAPDEMKDSATGRRVGAYLLSDKLGEGGMGAVYRAARADEQYEKEVAIKLVKAGYTSELTLRRFRAERQILAKLDHPNIARLFDGGVTEDGTPYFVMELVKGEPIDEYCDSRRLNINGRLQLFCRVCAAVQYAHQNLVVHRDLKPGNILVTPEDVPKLLDFGIARILNPETAPSMVEPTRTMLRMMTPEYASPEQVKGEAITTASDVYSLGVVLYVLLTGRHPYLLPTRSQQALMNAICEKDPLKPSSIVLQNVASQEVEQRRGITPGARKLVRRLAGDLDTIVLTALRKEPADRYSSAGDLAADIRRFLVDEPIAARRPTVAYRLQKFTHRHKALVAALVAVLGVLLAGIVTSTWEAARARNAQHLALAERDRANRVTDFMTGMFKVSDPGERLGNTLTAREVLDKAAHDIDTGLEKDPELQARMMHVMGVAYLNLGLYSRAQSLFERSLQLASSSIGTENLETLRTKQKLAWTLYQQGRLSDAELQQRRLLEIERRVLGPEHPDTVGVMGDLASTLTDEGHLPEAEQMQRDVLEIQKRIIGPEAFYTLVSSDNLASILAHEGRFAEAEKLEQQTLEIQRRVFGPENLTTIHYMMNDAEIKGYMGEDKEAERLTLQLLELERRVLGPDRPETAETTYSLATLKAKAGQIDEALALLRHAIDHGLLPREALAMGNDPYLKALHNDPRFVALAAYAKERALAQNSK